MQFKKTKLGYLKLGMIFTLFSIIPYIIIVLIGGPVMLGAVLFGGIPGMGFAMIFLILFMFLVQGWFVFWFYNRNTFRGGKK